MHNDKRLHVSRHTSERLACLVLAAGKGTRMNSARTKVLHPVLGMPLVSYPVLRAQELGASPVVAVLGHQRDEVEKALVARHGTHAIIIVEQKEPRGTGQAVMLGIEPLAQFGGLVLILSGDVPLLRSETLARLVDEGRRTGGLVMLSARVPDPTGYGRVVRDGQGRVQKIVEHKDATPEERGITEINGGIYVAPAPFLRDATAWLKPQNAQGEYYLTDVVERAAGGIGAQAIIVDIDELAGINDRRQLASAERTLSRRLVDRWLAHASFRDPDTVRVEMGVVIEPDAEIGRNVSLRGRTKIGRGVRIDDGVIIVDSDVRDGAEIKAYSVITESIVGPGAKVGPFAHLRPGSELGPDVHVGNFVETKKTRLGRGSKANHLTYLGDAVVGEKVNVGAGTITCNYNGYEKSQTTIEDGAFIGSDTQLVAPVKVGKKAVVAAGTTVTADVPDGALAITRVEQKHVAGYAERVAQRYAKKRPA